METETGERRRDMPPLPTDPRFWEWLGEQPAIPVPLQNAAGNDKLVIEGRCIFGGFSARETAAQAILFEFRDGTDATGPFLAAASIAGNSLSSSNLIPPGILCRRGVFLHIVSGSGVLQGAVYVKFLGAISTRQ